MLFVNRHIAQNLPYDLGHIARAPGSSGSLGEPLNHLAGFLAATDFHLPAILFALSLGTAEHIYELLELGKVHHIHRVVLGDIGESVAVRGGLVERPDIVKAGLALAHIARHECKGGSLDADAHAVGAYVGVGAVVGAVVVLALDAHMGAEVMLTGDARVARCAGVGDGVGGHFFVPLSLVYAYSIAQQTGLVNTFLQKNKEIFCLSFVTLLSPFCNYTESNLSHFSALKPTYLLGFRDLAH